MENSDSVVPVAEVDATTPPAPGAEEKKPTPPEGEAPSETQQETTEQQEARKQSKFQRRLDRQKTARIQAETRAEIAERELAEARAKLDAQSKPQGSEEPQRDQYEDYEGYTKALARWEAKQATAETLKADREAREGKEKQQQANQLSEKSAKAWVERETSFQAATKDYEAVVGAFTDAEGEMHSLSAQARIAIVESEVGPALLYRLGQLADTDPAAFERIANLSPVRQVAEIGKLEASVAMPARKTTNAPAPVNPVGARASGQKDPAKMSDSEYRTWRKSQGARWAQ